MSPERHAVWGRGSLWYLKCVFFPSLAEVTYSGLKNCCNVFQFWSGCDVALEKARMMLSVGGVK